MNAKLEKEIEEAVITYVMDHPFHSLKIGILLLQEIHIKKKKKGKKGSGSGSLATSPSEVPTDPRAPPKVME